MNNVYLDLFVCPSWRERSGSWKNQHMNAVRIPQPGFERALVDLFYGWLLYADEYKRRNNCRMEDGDRGEDWLKIGKGLRELLRGETGRLESSLLDDLIANVLRREDFDPDKL
jgi:hypothetical protein